MLCPLQQPRAIVHCALPYVSASEGGGRLDPHWRCRIHGYQRPANTHRVHVL